MLGTPFDSIFEFIESTNCHEEGSKKIKALRKAVAQSDAQLGRLIRQAVNEHRVQYLHDFATAVGQLRVHKPKPDYVRQAVAILGGISASEIALDKQLRPVPLRNSEILWVPIPSSRNPQMDDIKKFIEHQMKKELTPDEWERHKKKAERCMKELGYWEKFDHRPGRKKLKRAIHVKEWKAS